MKKALLPILVTVLGIVMEVREVQPWKALTPMLVTLHPSTMLFILAIEIYLLSEPFTQAVFFEVFSLYTMPFFYNLRRKKAMCTLNTPITRTIGGYL